MKSWDYYLAYMNRLTEATVFDAVTYARLAFGMPEAEAIHFVEYWKDLRVRGLTGR